MERLVAFIEIPAADFNRAVKFYESLLRIKLKTVDFGHEKMACFPDEQGVCPGSISWSSAIDFRPSGQGVLVSLLCENLEEALQYTTGHGGKVITSKTKIEAENRGYFATILDCEGNRIGLYSVN
ncbi:MAG: VOC family protein [Rikenellaceae bacterium]|nr:VOC family protein [Rikenellaceae bacterium]